MEVFSFSRLSLYRECPHRFYRKYVEGYKEEMTLPLAFGSAVHKGIEIVLKGGTMEEAISEAMFDINFHKEVLPHEVENMIKRAPIFGRNAIRGEIEPHFVLPLSNEPNAPKLQGFIDVLGNDYIFDWKTNRVPYDVESNHQIGLYAWAVSQMGRIRNKHGCVSGSLYFLRFRRESRAIYTPKKMEQARLWAYETAKEIQGKLELVKVMPELKDELFPATPNRNCSHCPFSISCFRAFSPYGKQCGM